MEEERFQELYDDGIILVAAAGNGGADDEEHKMQYPGGYDSVISVGATYENGGLAHFSSFNDQVNVVAAGVDILSLGSDSDSDYDIRSGTSHCIVSSLTFHHTVNLLANASLLSPLIWHPTLT